jgi:hypothetical protein
MKSPNAIVGIVFVWLAALEWCYEYFYVQYAPTSFSIIFGLLGSVLVLRAAYQKSDWRPIAVAALAAIAPFIALASRGFRV